MLAIIKNTIMEYVDIDEAELTEETKIVMDLSLNSYDFISIVGKLEAELGIEIPENELRGFQSLGDLDTFILKKLNE